MRTVSTSPSSGSANTVRRPTPTKTAEKENNPTPQEDNKKNGVQELSKRIARRNPEIPEDFAWLTARAIIDSHSIDIPRTSTDPVLVLRSTIKDGHYERGRFRLRGCDRLANDVVRICAVALNEENGRARFDLPVSMLMLKS